LEFCAVHGGWFQYHAASQNELSENIAQQAQNKKSKGVKKMKAAVWYGKKDV
jgi:hypothetical protein